LEARAAVAAPFTAESSDTTIALMFGSVKSKGGSQNAIYGTVTCADVALLYTHAFGSA